MAIKDIITDEVRKGLLWVVAFTGVCVLVGIGKLKPETVQYMLFSLMGYGASKLPDITGTNNEPSDSPPQEPK